MRLFNRHIHPQALTEYLDDYLSPARRQKVDAHLDACPHCRHEADSLRATVSGLRSMFHAQPQRSFILLNAPDLTPYTPHARARVPTWAAGLAASAAVLALVTVVSIDVLGGLSPNGGNGPQDTANLPQNNTPSSETYRNLTESASDAASDSATPPSETQVPSKRQGAAPGVTEIITTGSLSDQPAPTEAALVPGSVEGFITSANPDSSAIQTPALGNDTTSIFWRVLEGLLAAAAAVLSILFLQRLRRRPRQPI